MSPVWQYEKQLPELISKRIPENIVKSYEELYFSFFHIEYIDPSIQQFSIELHFEGQVIRGLPMKDRQISQEFVVNLILPPVGNFIEFHLRDE